MLVVMSGLQVQGLCKTYGSLQAVDQLNVSVSPGQITGFLGPNGAGKSTTMRAILGVVSIDEGTVSWNGSTVDDTFRSSIGYMPQERGLYPRMKVLEQVIYFARLAGLDAATATSKAKFWLEKVGLEDRLDDMTQDLSGGNQQRVQLAVALVHDPVLLVLDEPFAGLDPIASSVMKEILLERARAGVAVLFSSHQLSVVSDLCDQVVIVAKGSVVSEGSASQLRLASPTRRLEIRWREAYGDTWSLEDANVVSSERNHFIADVRADVAIESIMTQAARHGEITEFQFEPPTLESVFAELVEG